MQCAEAVVRQQTSVAGDYRLLQLDAGPWTAQVRPGQFVHMQVPGLERSALRRPFSVCGVSADNSLEILYKTIGRGTEAMATLPVGTPISLIGPLGNGFPLDVPPGRLPVLVAGGYGVAPLSFLASRLPTTGMVMIGGRGSGDILFEERFKALGWKVRCATEDGSQGLQGLVTDCFDHWRLKAAGCVPEVFACGPDGLLKALSDRARADGFSAWLSLDKHMGCGIGVCLACVQRLRSSDGGVYWGRVCRDGPVFEARQVVWEGEEQPDET